MRRRLLLASVIAVAAVAGLATALMRPVPALPAAPPPALPVLGAQIGSADRIELSHGDKLLWLERRGQVWGLSQEGGFPVRPAESAALVDGLIALRLDHSVSGDPAARGVADPDAKSGAGTLVRVLATSGAVLGAVILGNAPGPAYFRQPGLPQIWLASQPLPAGTDPADWTDRHLPAPELVGPDTAPMQLALAGLTITQIRSAPQVRLGQVRTVALPVADGTAVLTLGRANHQDWLQVSGSSAWARALSPYAFAVSGAPIPMPTQ